MAEVENPAAKEPPYHEIFTERLKLRTLRVGDAEGLMPILTSWEVMRWTTKPSVQDISQAERWIRDRALGQDVFNFVIELRDPSMTADEAGNPIIGIAGSHHIPKIGYLIHPSYWGKGIATEALKAIVPAIFAHFPSSSRQQDGDTAGLDYIEAWIDVENGASRRVLEKSGFVFCEEVDSPTDAPGHVEKVAVLRRAREGMNVKGMGLIAGGEDEEGKVVPPVQ